jgi:hemolysin D
MKKIVNYTVVSNSKIQTQLIRVLLVDDQSFARRFIHSSLKEDPNLNIIGSADNGQDAIAQVEQLKPDVVLIDLEMPEMNGITATEIIAQRFPECKVLILSSHETSDYLQKALRAGAKGYLIKGSPAKELTNAIHSIYQGYSQLSPGLLERVLTPEVEIVSDDEELEPNTLAESEWAESTRETIDTLPRVSLRAIFYILLFLLAGLIPWTALTKVDEVGTAKGKLEPQGRVVDLGASVDGKVVAISVREGEQVEANQQIMELDSEAVNAELQQQQQKLQGQQNQINQLELLKNQQVLALRTERQQNQARELEKEALIEQAQQSIAASQSDYQTAKIRYGAAQEKVPRYRQAYNQGALSKDVLLEAQHQAEEYQENIKQTRAEIARSRSALKEQQRGLNSLIQTNNLAILKSQEEYKATEQQIITIKADLAQTQSLISGLEYQMQQRIIYAPIAGTVFQLPIKQPGAVVRIGQMVTQIAPQGSPLVLRGKMISTDSGFLKVGLPVKVKFDAYPFQDYDIVPGRLSWISPDSRVSSDTSNSQGSPQPVQEFYEVEIELERDYVQNHERKVILTPGQTATADVVIRQRRIADIFLAPFRSLRKGGVQM